MAFLEPDEIEGILDWVESSEGHAAIVASQKPQEHVPNPQSDENQEPKTSG
jgi:hypothetical protein